MVRHCPQIVQGLVIFVTLCANAPCLADPATSRAQGEISQRAAAGWLQLQLDQRRAAPPVDARSPQQSQRQRIRDQEEAIRYREFLQAQERELQALRREERLDARDDAIPGAASASRSVRTQANLLELEAAQDRQRLRTQMNRERRLQPRTSPNRPRGAFE
jgi:hypothetical protein